MSKRISQNTDGSQPSVEVGDLNFGLGVGIRAGDAGPQEGGGARFLQNPFQGGDVEVYGGSGTSGGGSISIQGGDSSIAGDGGGVSIRCGDGPSGGGGIELIAGTRGTGVLGSSGDATIELQSGGSANFRAGILARAHGGPSSIPDFTVALQSGFDTGSPLLGVTLRSRLLVDGLGVFGPGGLNFEGWNSQDGAQAGDGVLFILGDGFDDGAGNASPGGEFRLTTGSGAATAPEKGGDFYVETGSGGQGGATALASGPGGDVEFFPGTGGVASGGAEANRGGGVEIVAGGGGVQSDPALNSGLGGPVLLQAGRAGNHSGGGFRGIGGTASLSAGSGEVGGSLGLAAGGGEQAGDTRGYIRILDQQIGTRTATPFAEVSSGSGVLFGNENGGLVSGIDDPVTASDSLSNFPSSTTVTTTGAATFSPGDIIAIEDCATGIEPDFGGAPQATNAPLTNNNGLFEVDSHVGNLLTISSSPAFEFCKSEFDPALAAGGSARRRVVSALRLNGPDIQYTTGSNTGSMAWQTFSTSTSNPGVQSAVQSTITLSASGTTSSTFGALPAGARIIRSRIDITATSVGGGVIDVGVLGAGTAVQFGLPAVATTLALADVSILLAAPDSLFVRGVGLSPGTVTLNCVVEYVL